MEIQEFEHRLGQYSHEAASANSEATKAFLFLEFARSVFREVQADTPHRLYPDLERHIKSEKTLLIKGRVDAFLGNLIIEFESNLKEAKREEAEGQLKRYTAILWNNKGIVEYLCIATDGLSFLVFRPRTTKTENFEENDIVLQPVDEFDIRKEDVSTLYKRLDRYMLYKTLVPPTSEDIVSQFGSDSIVLSDSMNILRPAWQRAREESGAMYREWAKYLSIVYGTDVDNEDLFIKHTYLATLAKLMVYSYYQENTLPTSNDVITQILTGGVFKRYGIENFLVEDFFSWIVKLSTQKDGVKVAHRILDGLSRYDLTKLNEDVFKELYQQLVDPVERHDLGEFYTPDWLAERIVDKVVDEPHARVLDPACGSGTFLAATIRRKLKLMSDIRIGERAGAIVQTVCGIDVHPLAVLISKANYLMALGNVLAKKSGTIVIPVYMADSIIFPVPKKSVATFGNKESEDVYSYRVDKQSELLIPKSLVDKEYADGIVDSIGDQARKMVAEPRTSAKGFQSYLEKKYGVSEEQFQVIQNTTNTLAELIRGNRDTIHPYILRNIYKPATIGKFDILVGNPPWLTYRDIKSVERQKQIRDLTLKDYTLFNPSGGRTVSNLEQATLFMIMTSHLYLKDHGHIAFVMPRSVFSSDHHDEFRSQKYSQVKLKLYEVWDLEKLEPLFNIPSCALLAKKGKITEYPVKCEIIKGKVAYKNISLKIFNAKNSAKDVKIDPVQLNLIRIGTRTSWSERKPHAGASHAVDIKSYKDNIERGSELTPRPFWFVEIKAHGKLGLDLNKPHMESTKRATELAKGQYAGITMKGEVEKITFIQPC